MQEAFDWGEVDYSVWVRCLLAICLQVKQLLSDEPRLLKLTSPTYILGNCWFISLSHYCLARVGCYFSFIFACL